MKLIANMPIMHVRWIVKTERFMMNLANVQNVKWIWFKFLRKRRTQMKQLNTQMTTSMGLHVQCIQK